MPGSYTLQWFVVMLSKVVLVNEFCTIFKCVDAIVFDQHGVGSFSKSYLTIYARKHCY